MTDYSYVNKGSHLLWSFKGQNHTHTLARLPVCSHTLVVFSVSGVRREQKCTVSYTASW